MRILLYELFGQYGQILDINIQSQYRMRGQAFVVYDSKEDASTAMRILQNYYFYGKPIVNSIEAINFAMTQSDIIAKREGTFIPRDPGHSIQKRAQFFAKLSEKQEKIGSNGLELVHNILFVDGLDSSISEEVLKDLFGLYQGLKEVRYMSEKGLAFIEYETPQAASLALTGLNEYRVTPQVSLNLAYAKR